MKVKKLAATSAPLLLLCLVAAALPAQGADAPLAKEAIVARAWKAMFGERQNKDIQSIYVEGHFHGRLAPSRIFVKRPNLFRNENEGGVLAFDGRRAAWVKREPDKDGSPRQPELIKPEQWRHFEVDIALVFPAFFDHPAELQAIEKANGADAYRLRVQLPLGGSVTYFVDCASFLVTRRLVDWDGDPAAEPWENLIAGYTNYDGILFPDGYSYAGREGREKGLYRNVRFNVDPADELFRIPDELK